MRILCINDYPCDLHIQDILMYNAESFKWMKENAAEVKFTFSVMDNIMRLSVILKSAHLTKIEIENLYPENKWRSIL